MALTLSDKQLDTMRKQMDKYHCLPKLVDHLREDYANSPQINKLSETELAAKVRQSLHTAWDLKLYSQPDVFTFVAYDLVLFPCFGQHPQVRHFLDEYPGVMPDARMLSLCLEFKASDWNRIKDECELLAAESASDHGRTT